MMLSLDDYWDVQGNQVLYSKDTYYRDHLIDVRQHLKIAFIVGCLATILIFTIGILVVL